MKQLQRTFFMCTIPFCIVAVLIIFSNEKTGLAANPETKPTTKRITITINRGDDIGQNFGSLFELTNSDGSLVIGAGFQNAYNTRYRADRHAIQFYIRPTGGERSISTEKIPRPNNLCGTYLYGRDEVVRSTYGGVKAWEPQTKSWKSEADHGGTNEIMRIGEKLLSFGESEVKYDGRTILSPPDKGSYQLFFYANGFLCFYHVNKGNGPYRPYVNDGDGFSKLYACPWTAADPVVDLSKSIIFNLPVVGETTFAWGELKDQIVTGSNIGGFYVFENKKWRMILAPKLKTSYQLYSTMIFHDKLLMGQYPTGRIFQYDGSQITDLPGWPPKLKGVSGSSREAQTTIIYGGDIFVGVWPWGELWRYNPDSKSWAFTQRMFDHPALSKEIIHPYDVENRDGKVKNQWGQRVTSLIPAGNSLFVSTSSKSPVKWSPAKFPFLAPEKWKSYGAVHQLTMSGHLGAAVKWSDGPTEIEFIINNDEVSISQDGKVIAETTITGPIAKQLNKTSKLVKIKWGEGIYGQFNGDTIEGVVHD